MIVAQRMPRLVLVAALAAALAGCQTPEKSAKAPRKLAVAAPPPPCAAPQAPGIYLTGMALRGTGRLLDEQLIDYTLISPPGIAVPPGLSVVSNHDVRWCLHGELPGGSTGAFQVVMGPAETGELYAEGWGVNPIIGFHVKSGWAFLNGDRPTGGSPWGTGSAGGTQWALRISNTTESSGHYFYNLEPALRTGTTVVAEDHIVYVRGGWPGDPVAVPPQQRVVLRGAKMTEAPEAENFTAEDLAFIAFLRERVLAAQVGYAE